MYFNNCKTEAEVKNMFKSLASLHHPAKGGFLKVWELVNSEYLEALKLVNSLADQAPEENRPEQSPDQELINKAAEVHNLPGVRVVISGSWIWATGNTKESKNVLKSAGFTWAKKADDLSAWFYRSGKNKCFRRTAKGLPLGQIAIKYGAQEV